MKVFDYKCQVCGHEEEMFVDGVAIAVDTCPQCQHLSFTRQIPTPKVSAGEEMAARNDLVNIQKQDEEKKQRRKRDANGTRNSGNVIVR